MTSNVPFEKNKMASTLATSVITTVCSQNARRLSARWNLKEIKSAMEKKLKSVTSFSLGNYQRESCSANFIQQIVS